ncbi:MAG: class I SAM-dependent methyltransferase [Caldilineaceae bacterium]|nr:class I SAM-dependent methyltransferase [Caldilineaceae bacterium]
MNNAELKAVFDRQAASYDQQWLRLAPINQGLYFLLEAIFAELPADARLLCVGVGTGNELLHLARRFPGWHFTAVEPSDGMLAVCRQRAEAAGIRARCTFHEGYLDTLPTEVRHDGATCFLVSQFMVDQAARTAFFQQIADRLKPHGLLASADLAAEVETDSYDALLRLWQRVMSPTDLSSEGLRRMQAAYARDVAVLPPATVATIIQAGGFTAPVPFFQAGLIHAWFAQSC